MRQSSPRLGAPSSASQGLGTSWTVSTGRFLRIGAASRRAQLHTVKSSRWKVSNGLRHYRCHSRASSRWFLNPRGIRAKPGDPESLRVTVAGSFLLPIPSLPTPAAFLSPHHPNLFPGPGVQTPRGRLSPLPESQVLSSRGHRKSVPWF